jgi:hypothetical protein
MAPLHFCREEYLRQPTSFKGVTKRRSTFFDVVAEEQRHAHRQCSDQMDCC